MNNKFYYISTGLLSALMCFSAGMYFFKNEEITQAFLNFGYPTYIIYPLATLKLLGLIAIWSRKSMLLLNLAYSGYFFNFILAFCAHISIKDNDWPGSVLAMVFLLTSFYSQSKKFNLNK